MFKIKFLNVYLRSTICFHPLLICNRFHLKPSNQLKFEKRINYRSNVFVFYFYLKNLVIDWLKMKFVAFRATLLFSLPTVSVTLSKIPETSKIILSISSTKTLFSDSNWNFFSWMFVHYWKYRMKVDGNMWLIQVIGAENLRRWWWYLCICIGR